MYTPTLLFGLLPAALAAPALVLVPRQDPTAVAATEVAVVPIGVDAAIPAAVEVIQTAVTTASDSEVEQTSDFDDSGAFGTTSCGGKSYSTGQVQQAAAAACDALGDPVGKYPHQYRNFEGFNFAVSGPWNEFPILSNGVYTGGSPGADRVIINNNCDIAGLITHSGAGGNNFVGCRGEFGTD